MTDDPEEPSIWELLEGIVEIFLSITLVDVLRRKLVVRSYREFFNRTIGIGLIASTVGFLYLFLSQLFGAGVTVEIVGINLTNVIVPLVIIFAVWMLSGVNREVNDGRGIDEMVGDLLPGKLTVESTPGRAVLAKLVTVFLYGGMLYWILTLYPFGAGSVLETIKLLLVLSTVLGLLMLLTGYLLRELFDIFYILWIASKGEPSIETTEETTAGQRR